jgi:hypothetical protein
MSSHRRRNAVGRTHQSHIVAVPIFTAFMFDHIATTSFLERKKPAAFIPDDFFDLKKQSNRIPMRYGHAHLANYESHDTYDTYDTYLIRHEDYCFVCKDGGTVVSCQVSSVPSFVLFYLFPFCHFLFDLSTFSQFVAYGLAHTPAHLRPVRVCTTRIAWARKKRTSGASGNFFSYFEPN